MKHASATAGKIQILPQHHQEWIFSRLLSASLSHAVAVHTLLVRQHLFSLYKPICMDMLVILISLFLLAAPVYSHCLKANTIHEF